MPPAPLQNNSEMAMISRHSYSQQELSKLMKNFYGLLIALKVIVIAMFQFQLKQKKLQPQKQKQLNKQKQTQWNVNVSRDAASWWGASTHLYQRDRREPNDQKYPNQTNKGCCML